MTALPPWRLTPLPWRGRGRRFSVRPRQPDTLALVGDPESRRVKLFARNHAGCTRAIRRHASPKRQRLLSTEVLPLPSPGCLSRVPELCVWKGPCLGAHAAVPVRWGCLISHRPQRPNTPWRIAGPHRQPWLTGQLSGAVVHTRSQHCTRGVLSKGFVIRPLGPLSPRPGRKTWSALAATGGHLWDPAGTPTALVL